MPQGPVSAKQLHEHEHGTGARAREHGGATGPLAFRFVDFGLFESFTIQLYSYLFIPKFCPPEWFLPRVTPVGRSASGSFKSRRDLNAAGLERSGCTATLLPATI